MKESTTKIDVKVIFAERFASLRKSRGLTQRAIAEKLGITDRAVSKWETGRGTPKFSDTPILASISELRRIIYSVTKKDNIATDKYYDILLALKIYT